MTLAYEPGDVPTIIETVRIVGSNSIYTGKYRLIGVPGNYINLPGRGGRRTKQAARRAIAVFQAGGDNFTAQVAAWSRP